MAETGRDGGGRRPAQERAASPEAATVTARHSRRGRRATTAAAMTARASPTGQGRGTSAPAAAPTASSTA
ncbi:MAG: hypothetical protein ABR540_20410 [Acidimicrobiales bacterium]